MRKNKEEKLNKVSLLGQSGMVSIMDRMSKHTITGYMFQKQDEYIWGVLLGAILKKIGIFMVVNDLSKLVVEKTENPLNLWNIVKFVSNFSTNVTNDASKYDEKGKNLWNLSKNYVKEIEMLQTSFIYHENG